MLLIGLAMGTSLMAADQVVTNTNDSGAGSLRQAIIDVGAGDEITFDAGVTGTITLTSGELAINKDMTITGPGADVLSIDGNASSRIFEIGTSYTNPTVTITGLTITNGSETYGGGIYNYSDNLTLENCAISGNSASSWGGGMFNQGYRGHCSPTLTNCTISGNSAAGGGGMYNSGRLGVCGTTLINCTISGNSADYGGGMYNTGVAGHCLPTLANCIMWDDNATTSGPEVYNASASPLSSYCDIAGSGGGGTDIDSDPLFVTAVPPAPSSGGDLNLSVGSPCINTGLNSINSTPFDIAGNPRIQDGTIDMGAYEYSVAPPTATTWTGASSNSWCDPGNWDNGVPDETIDAVIDPVATQPVVDCVATCKDLTLNTGTVLSYTGGNALTVHGDVYNSAGKRLIVGGSLILYSNINIED